MNGGSFRVSAVLSYKTEEAFVKYYDKTLPEWHTGEVRIATLREVYRIASELKMQQDGNGKSGTRQDKKSRRSRGSKDDSRGNERTDLGLEPGPDDARDKI